MTNITIIVTETQSGVPIENALVEMDGADIGRTNVRGTLSEDAPDGRHTFKTTVFGMDRQRTITIISGQPQTVELRPAFDLTLDFQDETFTNPLQGYATQGDVVGLVANLLVGGTQFVGNVDFEFSAGSGTLLDTGQLAQNRWHTLGAVGAQTVSVTATDSITLARITVQRSFNVLQVTGLQPSGALSISLGRPGGESTGDQPFWVALRNSANRIRFGDRDQGYVAFIDTVLCAGDTSAIGEPNATKLNRRRSELYQPVHGIGAYELLRTATQVFLLLECGVVIEERDRYTDALLYDPANERSRLGSTLAIGEVRRRLQAYLGNNQLPYIDRILGTAFGGQNPAENIYCEGFLSERAQCPPMLELIWSYWHEEAMLVQTMNAISLRFQNRRSKGSRDPLAHLEISPLFPLNNLLWGYVQEDHRRLSVARRAAEYQHNIGFNMYGQAVSGLRPADTRSKFLEAFHNLLSITAPFFRQADDTTVVPDGFPLLNALREVHLVLAEGAHNQFGDLPWTARVEMLMQQWILARPEFREFLHSRPMVPYREAWMPQVDTMKTLQGWTDTSVTQFNFLAVYGEQLLLSIRYGDWIDVIDPAQAANWAIYWRPEIQGYIHAYRAATGVDLAVEARDSRQSRLMVTQPSELLRKRGRNGQMSTAAAPAATRGFRQRRAARAARNGRK